MPEENRCQGITVSGERCRLPAGPSGYCHIHDPVRAAERKAAQDAFREKEKTKGKRLKEVVQIVKTTCDAKGWGYRVINVDRKDWQYATVSVSRTVSIGNYVTGVLDISLGDEIKINLNKTSFYGQGLKDLYSAILTRLGDLTWVELKKRHKDEPMTQLNQLERLLKRFHTVARQLRRRRSNRETLIIRDEYDVQDLLHALLKIDFDDVRPEDYSPSYAGSSSRLDFLLKNEKTVVEVKMTSEKLRDKVIGEQLIIDMKRYQVHPDCDTLVCFVYDPEGYIRNPIGLENDLSGRHDNIDVQVFVTPH